MDNRSTKSTPSSKSQFPPLITALDTYIDSNSITKASEVIENVKSNRVKRLKKKKAFENKKSSTESPGKLQQITKQKPNQEHSPRLLKTKAQLAEDDKDNFSVIQPHEPSTSSSHYLPQSPGAPQRESTAHSQSFSSPRSAPRGGRVYKSLDQTSFNPPRSATDKNPLNVIPQSTIGFNKAVESIAALKLHNFAMKRRQHMSEKIKLLKEIRNFERESQEDVKIAQKSRQNEMLAAWKIRFYIEFLRYNSAQHIIEIVENKNIELEEECATWKATTATTKQHYEDMKTQYEQSIHQIDDIQLEKRGLLNQLETLQIELNNTKSELYRQVETLQSSHQSLTQGEYKQKEDHIKLEMLRSELTITQMTCQEMIKNNLLKENKINALQQQLQTMSTQSQSINNTIETLQQQLLEQKEVNLMQKEDSKSQIHNMLSIFTKMQVLQEEKEEQTKTILDLQQQILTQQEIVTQSQQQVQEIQNAWENTKHEKENFNKVLTDLALQLQTKQTLIVNNEETIQKQQIEFANIQQILTEKTSIIEEQDINIQTYQEQIEFLVNQNELLSSEIECVSMTNEDNLSKLWVVGQDNHRIMDYSRHLEEELFLARRYPGSMNGTLIEIEPDEMKISQPQYLDEAYTTVPLIQEGEKPPSSEQYAAVSSSQEHSISSLAQTPREAPPTGTLEEEIPPPSMNRRRVSVLSGSQRNVVDDKLVSLVNTIEQKMASMEQATNYFKILIEKAESIERNQIRRRNSTLPAPTASSTSASTSISPETSDSVPMDSTNLSALENAMARDREQSVAFRNRLTLRLNTTNQPSSNNNPNNNPHSPNNKSNNANNQLVEGNKIPFAETPQGVMEKKQYIDEHLYMERIYSEMQSGMDQLNQELGLQHQEILQLQDLRNAHKSEVNKWKKNYKKIRHRDPELADYPEEIQLSGKEIDRLKIHIDQNKAANLDLNAKAIALQTEMFHLNHDLQENSKEFYRLYQEHISEYYPNDLMDRLKEMTPPLRNLLKTPNTPGLSANSGGENLWEPKYSISEMDSDAVSLSSLDSASYFDENSVGIADSSDENSIKPTSAEPKTPKSKKGIKKKGKKKGKKINSPGKSMIAIAPVNEDPSFADSVDFDNEIIPPQSEEVDDSQVHPVHQPGPNGLTPIQMIKTGVFFTMASSESPVHTPQSTESVDEYTVPPAPLPSAVDTEYMMNHDPLKHLGSILSTLNIESEEQPYVVQHKELTPEKSPLKTAVEEVKYSSPKVEKVDASIQMTPPLSSTHSRVQSRVQSKNELMVNNPDISSKPSEGQLNKDFILAEEPKHILQETTIEVSSAQALPAEQPNDSHILQPSPSVPKIRSMTNLHSLSYHQLPSQPNNATSNYENHTNDTQATPSNHNNNNTPYQTPLNSSAYNNNAYNPSSSSTSYHNSTHSHRDMSFPMSSYSNYHNPYAYNSNYTPNYTPNTSTTLASDNFFGSPSVSKPSLRGGKAKQPKPIPDFAKNISNSPYNSNPNSPKKPEFDSFAMHSIPAMDSSLKRPQNSQNIQNIQNKSYNQSNNNMNPLQPISSIETPSQKSPQQQHQQATPQVNTIPLVPEPQIIPQVSVVLNEPEPLESTKSSEDPSLQPIPQPLPITSTVGISSKTTSKHAPKGLKSESHIQREQIRVIHQFVRNTISKLKSEMETLYANAESAVENVNILQDAREEVRQEIGQWFEQFYELNGYEALIQDRQRSKIYEKLINEFLDAQQALKEAYETAPGIVQLAHEKLQELITIQQEFIEKYGKQQIPFEDFAKTYQLPQLPTYIAEDPRHITWTQYNQSDDEDLLTMRVEDTEGLVIGMPEEESKISEIDFGWSTHENEANSPTSQGSRFVETDSFENNDENNNFYDENNHNNETEEVEFDDKNVNYVSFGEFNKINPETLPSSFTSQLAAQALAQTAAAAIATAGVKSQKVEKVHQARRMSQSFMTSVFGNITTSSYVAQPPKDKPIVQSPKKSIKSSKEISLEDIESPPQDLENIVLKALRQVQKEFPPSNQPSTNVSANVSRNPSRPVSRGVTIKEEDEPTILKKDSSLSPKKTNTEIPEITDEFKQQSPGSMKQTSAKLMKSSSIKSSSMKSSAKINESIQDLEVAYDQPNEIQAIEPPLASPTQSIQETNEMVDKIVDEQPIEEPEGNEEMSLVDEYNRLKKELRRWKTLFFEEYGREPNISDFNYLDQDLKVKIARKNQLKKLLADVERASTPSSKNQKPKKSKKDKLNRLDSF